MPVISSGDPALCPDDRRSMLALCTVVQHHHLNLNAIHKVALQQDCPQTGARLVIAAASHLDHDLAGKLRPAR